MDRAFELVHALEVGYVSLGRKPGGNNKVFALRRSSIGRLHMPFAFVLYTN